MEATYKKGDKVLCLSIILDADGSIVSSTNFVPAIISDRHHADIDFEVTYIVKAGSVYLLRKESELKPMDAEVKRYKCLKDIDMSGLDESLVDDLERSLRTKLGVASKVHSAADGYIMAVLARAGLVKLSDVYRRTLLACKED
jgi:hypothetical protein